VEKLAKRVISSVNIVLTITTIALFVEKKWGNWRVKVKYGNSFDKEIGFTNVSVIYERFDCRADPRK